MLSPTEIYDNVDALAVRKPTGGAFGLDLMEAVGAPRATIAARRRRCLRRVHLLQQPLTLGATGFELMMREAGQVSVRIWATASPFERKALLKVRSYRWASGDDRGPKAWWRDVPEPLVDVELAWLRDHVYGDPGGDVALNIAACVA